MLQILRKTPITLSLCIASTATSAALTKNFVLSRKSHPSQRTLSSLRRVWLARRVPIGALAIVFCATDGLVSAQACKRSGNAFHYQEPWSKLTVGGATWARRACRTWRSG